MNLINQPEQVSQYCLVSSLALREAKNGSKYVELTLSDKTASVPGCKLWNVTKEILLSQLPLKRLLSTT